MNERARERRTSDVVLGTALAFAAIVLLATYTFNNAAGAGSA